MPRVNRDNRDLQRRLAARRGRDRRRPATEQRYRFAPADTVETQAEAEEELFDGAPEMVAGPAAKSSPAAKAKPVAGPRPSGRPSAKPFSAYAAEYAYVGSDLRRIVVVVGSLLVVLIVLHSVLPR